MTGLDTDRPTALPAEAAAAVGSQRFIRRVLPTMLVAVFALVAAVDLGLLALASGYERFQLLDHASIRFAPTIVVADLRHRQLPPQVTQIGGRHALVSGWGRAVGGGVWLGGDAAVIDIASGTSAPAELVVRARATGPLELAIGLNGAPLGARDFAGGELEVRRWPLPAGIGPATEQRLELSVTAGRRARESLLVAGMVLASTAGVPWLDLVRPAVLLDRETRTVALRQPGRLVVAMPATVAAHELHLEYRFVRPREGAWPKGRGVIRLCADGGAVTVATLDASRRLHDRVQVPLGATDGSARLEVALESLEPGAVLVLDDPIVIPGTAYLTAPG